MMNKIATCVLSATLVISSLGFGSCETPPFGPPGPQGPTGPTGPTGLTGPTGYFSDDYVFAYFNPNQEDNYPDDYYCILNIDFSFFCLQILSQQSVPVAMNFPAVGIITSDITHPNPTDFVIHKAGYYLVSWTFSLANLENNPIVSAEVYLNGSITGNFHPAPFETMTVPQNSLPPDEYDYIEGRPYSGQAIIYLYENEIFQLQLLYTSFLPDDQLYVLSPSISMIRIQP